MTCPVRWILVGSGHRPEHGGIGTYVNALRALATHAAGWSIDVLAPAVAELGADGVRAESGAWAEGHREAGL